MFRRTFIQLFGFLPVGVSATGDKENKPTDNPNNLPVVVLHTQSWDKYSLTQKSQDEIFNGVEWTKHDESYFRVALAWLPESEKIQQPDLTSCRSPSRCLSGEVYVSETVVKGSISIEYRLAFTLEKPCIELLKLPVSFPSMEADRLKKMKLPNLK